MVSMTKYCVLCFQQNEDTLIQVEDSSTHIFCEGDEQLRLRLRNILLQCLNKF